MVATTRAGAEKAGTNRGMDNETPDGASNVEGPINVIPADEANAVMLQQTGDNASVASDTGTAASPDVQQLTIRVLELQLELERLKQRGSGEREHGARSKLGRYAEELRAVLAPMPESDELVPAWFRSAENMLNNRAIPDDARGPIIVPFLNERWWGAVVREGARLCVGRNEAHSRGVQEKILCLPERQGNMESVYY